jgi:hypothetical protein
MDEIDPKREIFGHLLDITDESLVLLASRIAQTELKLPKASGNVVARLSGSYNIVHIVQYEGADKIVIRVPATGRDSDLTGNEEKAMQSYAATVQLIHERSVWPHVTRFSPLSSTSPARISVTSIILFSLILFSSFLPLSFH